jgi:hypothetical protein
MARTVHLWVFPVGILVALVLMLALNPLIGVIAAFVWGFAVVPHGAVWLHRRAVPLTDDERAEVETGYWSARGSWQSGAH